MSDGRSIYAHHPRFDFDLVDKHANLLCPFLFYPVSAVSGGSVLAVDDEALRDLAQNIGVEWEKLATYLHLKTDAIYR